MHLIFIPNFIKSNKTYIGIVPFGGYVYTEEILTKTRYIIITITQCNCLKWLGIVDKVRTNIVGMDKDIFIPELDF